MQIDTVKTILQRIDAIWPPKKQPTKEERGEWVAFLRTLDGDVALRSVDELRNQLGWHPSMADFRSAYQAAASLPAADVLALPAGDEDGRGSLEDRYGTAQEAWVYCWRCDMALTLQERSTAPFDEIRGFRHSRCPKPGSAPTIPNKDRLERNDHFDRRHIIIGRTG